MIRHSIYSGTWYPRSQEDIKDYIDPKAKPLNAIAALCPHAGWLYSGKTAGKVYSRLPVADVYVIIGPNHSGHGAPLSIYKQGVWKMPMGDVNINEETAKLIINNSEFLQEDYNAHSREHSIEVQIPFIQYFNNKAEIVPISMMSDEDEICSDIGRSISSAIKKLPNKKFLIIASSDMSHYENRKIAKDNDSYAIDQILSLNPESLLEVVSNRGISMCGAGPVASMIYAAKDLGALEAQMIHYSTSGDITGDDESVVSYAGIILY
ncbi:MAG: AmmeMemoRadiSam system protein B [bacterium]